MKVRSRVEFLKYIGNWISSGPSSVHAARPGVPRAIEARDEQGSIMITMIISSVVTGKTRKNTASNLGTINLFVIIFSPRKLSYYHSAINFCDLFES